MMTKKVKTSVGTSRTVSGKFRKWTLMSSWIEPNVTGWFSSPVSADKGFKMRHLHRPDGDKVDKSTIQCQLSCFLVFPVNTFIYKSIPCLHRGIADSRTGRAVKLKKSTYITRRKTLQHPSQQCPGGLPVTYRQFRPHGVIEGSTKHWWKHPKTLW